MNIQKFVQNVRRNQQSLQALGDTFLTLFFISFLVMFSVTPVCAAAFLLLATGILGFIDDDDDPQHPVPAPWTQAEIDAERRKVCREKMVAA